MCDEKLFRLFNTAITLPAVFEEIFKTILGTAFNSIAFVRLYPCVIGSYASFFLSKHLFDIILAFLVKLENRLSIKVGSFLSGVLQRSVIILPVKPKIGHLRCFIPNDPLALFVHKETIHLNGKLILSIYLRPLILRKIREFNMTIRISFIPKISNIILLFSCLLHSLI